MKINSDLNGCMCIRMNGGKPQLLCKSAHYSFLIKYPTWSPESNRKNRRHFIYKYTLLKRILTNVCTSCEQIMFVMNKGQRRTGRPTQRGSTY